MLALVVVALASNHSVLAQDTNEINQLKQQLREMRENFERVQNEQHQQIDALTKKLDELTKEKAADAEKKKLAEQLAAELGTTNQPATASAPSVAAADSRRPFVVSVRAPDDCSGTVGVYEYQLRRADGCRRLDRIRSIAIPTTSRRS